MTDNHFEKPRRNERHTILVVDDEEGIRRGCDRVLRSEGHQVLLAGQGEQGLKILGQQPDMDLVLVDLRMPGIGALDFLLRAREIAPETVFVVITAYATIEAAVEATKRGAYDFIAKPFTPDTLLCMANRALERARLVRERNRLEKERRQRMLELATEKSRFRTVIDCMGEGVIICNSKQELVLYNPAALKILSRVRSLRIPLAMGKVLECGDLVQMISTVSKQEKRLSNEIKLGNEPEETWVLANVSPVADVDSGQFLGTVTVLRDISELKRVEQVKAQFINMVAHELRAPLTAVDGYLSVMDQGYVKEKEKQHEIINRSRHRIAALVDLVGDLLDISRMEGGAVQREIMPQRIDSVLKAVVELMQSLAKQNNISLEVQVSDSLPPIHADQEELIRLFGNLVDNAIKYNKLDGFVRVMAEQDGLYVRVSVADTGIGISKEGLGLMFSEFFREKRHETSSIQGTGLGLSIVKRIVDFYNGRIEVKSELDKGSTITVALPFKQSEYSK
jgi:two-component system phosphate regulon sensor histidine kinase PhoR